MRQRLLLTLLIAASGPGAGAASAWDHRGMQSHHRSPAPAERPLAPGETRIGRITIGAPAASNRQTPDTLEHTTQRTWQQRTSFTAPTSASSSDAPNAPAGGRAPGRSGGRASSMGGGGRGSLGR